MPEYYPPVGFHFRVDFGLPEGEYPGGEDIRFQEVSGLGASITPFTYEEGGENRFTHRMPNRASYGNITLKRGLLKDSAVISWVKAGLENFEFRATNVTISLLDENHLPLDSWLVVNAWPVKWEVSAFNAQESQIAVETMELAFNHFRRI